MIALLLAQLAVAAPPSVELRGSAGVTTMAGPRTAVYDPGPSLTVGAGIDLSDTVVGVRLDVALHEGLFYELQADQNIDPTQRAQGDSVFVGGAVAVDRALVKTEIFRFDVRGAAGLMRVPLLMSRTSWEETVLRRWGTEDPGIHNGVKPYVLVGLAGELHRPGSPIGVGLDGEGAYGVGIGPWVSLRAMVRFHAR